METQATTNNGEQTTTTEQQTTEQATTQQTDQATTTQQTEQTATTTETTKVEGAPETYEFKAPEGQIFDAEFLKAYSETAKELNLTQENAQKLIDKVGPVMEKQQQAKIDGIRNGWAEASKTDKEFGGTNLEANLGIAKTALDKFGTPELKELINTSGLGNHPELIRFFYRAGKAISSDTFVGGRQEGKGVPKDFNAMAGALYT